MRGGARSTTRRGNGAGTGGPARSSKDDKQPFTPGHQPPGMHKSAGKEARAIYLAKLAQRQDKALAVIDRAMDLALKAEEAPMINAGLQASKAVTEALHGKPAQAITGEDGGALTVLVRRIVDTGDDAGS